LLFLIPDFIRFKSRPDILNELAHRPFFSWIELATRV
jgi:hypothetical protein